MVVTVDILVVHRCCFKETSTFFARVLMVSVKSFFLMLVCWSEVMLGVGFGLTALVSKTGQTQRASLHETLRALAVSI
jgi:hypothetical protein